MKQEERYVCEI